MIWWPDLGAVLTHLKTEGDLTEPIDEDAIVEGARALPVPVPWYVKGALFIGGLFAGNVLSCTCAPLGALSSAVAFVLPGVLITVAAVIARIARTERMGDWLDPLLFAGMIAGKQLLLLGLVMFIGMNGPGGPGEMSIVAAIMGVLELFLLLVYPDRWHRTLGVIIVCVCLSAISFDLDLWPVRDVVTGLAVALGAASLAARPVFAGTPLREILGPIGLGFVLYALGGMARFWTGWAEEGWILVVGVASGTLALGVTAWTLARVDARPVDWIVGLLGAILLAAVGLSMPGLAVALAFMLLALLARHLPVLVASIIALVAYGSWAYTAFEWPVGLKALALIGSGVILLVLRFYLRSAVKVDEDPAEVAA